MAKRAQTKEDRKNPPVRRRRSQVDLNNIADYANCDPALLHYVVQCLTAQGMAIQFSLTSDGGAYALRIYGDGEPFSEYVKPHEDINARLRELAEDYS